MSLFSSDAHQPHQSACLISIPEIHKAQSTDTDGSSFCSTSVEEDLRKVSLFAVLDMFVAQRHIAIISRVFLAGTDCFNGCCLLDRYQTQ